MHTRMVAFGTGISILMMLVSSPPANASTKHVPNIRVEQVLKAWGFPVGQVDGVFDNRTRQSMCVWRDLTGNNESHALPSIRERFLIHRAIRPKVPTRLVVGLNVNITCQAVIWVKTSRKTHAPMVFKVFPATTGSKEFPTRTGKFRIYAQVNDWQESDLYPGAMMYRPKYFDGGQAFHGSATDSLVVPFPASHGCVRMFHSAIDELWRNKIGIGTQVTVYGRWRNW